MSRRLGILALGVVLTLATGAPSAQSPTLKVAMRAKLANAQGLLEAVVKADYALIARHAEPLGQITDAEIASWQAVAQPEYTQQAIRFLLAVEGLRDAAASKDIEAVTVEYAALVSSCIRCHTNVRNSGRTPER